MTTRANTPYRLQPRSFRIILDAFASVRRTEYSNSESAFTRGEYLRTVHFTDKVTVTR